MILVEIETVAVGGENIGNKVYSSRQHGKLKWILYEKRHIEKIPPNSIMSRNDRDILVS